MRLPLAADGDAPPETADYGLKLHDRPALDFTGFQGPGGLGDVVDAGALRDHSGEIQAAAFEPVDLNP